MDRLFVPLNKEPFEDFNSKGKTYELRSYGRNFTEKFVYEGRDVELRKGYSGEILWGKIGKVQIGTLEEILSKVYFKKITPEADSEEKAKKQMLDILGEKEKYIAFEVRF